MRTGRLPSLIRYRFLRLARALLSWSRKGWSDYETGAFPEKRIGYGKFAGAA